MTESTGETIEAREPPEIGAKAVAEGVKSANLAPSAMIVLALLAGAYIALGGLFYTTAIAGAEELPYGVGQLLGGLVFTVGLALVLVGGSELFTGNTMTLVIARAQREVTGGQLLTNWGIVYAANFVGSLVIAGLVLASSQYTMGDGAVGAAALGTALDKVQLTFVQAVASGVLANFLVCLAVWLAYSARSTTDKIVALLLPIWAFVAMGFEHSVANMFLIPMGLLIKAAAPAEFWSQIGTSASAYADLTWSSFLVHNLVPATIGNALAGAIMVALAYWFAYLRRA
ncbi:formate transporter FocA [Nitriliruptoraceae bacterium ZYF776]|nr:formate transporter FocA [Profundirhabdus halotolerans]